MPLGTPFGLNIHALVGLTRQLAQELGPFGVTVNSVAPGFVLSNPATQRQWESYGHEGQTRLVERIFTRRTGKPAGYRCGGRVLCLGGGGLDHGPGAFG